MLQARQVSQIAQAEVTKDMLELLLEHFDSLASPDGVVTVQLRDNTLWMAAADGSPELLGIASLPAALDYIK